MKPHGGVSTMPVSGWKQSRWEGPKRPSEGVMQGMSLSPAGARPAHLSSGPYLLLKIAVIIVLFHFCIRLLVQFADILLPFFMALILVTVLEPIKSLILSVWEGILILTLLKIPSCSCCLRLPKRKETESLGSPPRYGNSPPRNSEASTTSPGPQLRDEVRRLLLVVSIILSLLIAFRCGYVLVRIVWLSGQAIMEDFEFYKQGSGALTVKFQTQIEEMGLQGYVKANFDLADVSDYALHYLRLLAEFLTQHVFYTVSQIMLTTIFVLFLLYSPIQKDFAPVMQGVFSAMETYLKLKTAISVAMGILNGAVLAIIGLELPAAWGMMTFFANFIPNIGGPMVSIIPCIITLLDIRKTLHQAAAAFFAQFFLHFAIGNFLEPLIFGNAEEVHSVVLLLGLSFFGYIWGVTGMFLAVPILCALHAWLSAVAHSALQAEAREDARFLANILEGRWLMDELTAYGREEEFYHEIGEESQEIEIMDIHASKTGTTTSNDGLTPAMDTSQVPKVHRTPMQELEAADAAQREQPEQYGGPVWFERLQELWEIRHEVTGEVLLPGLLIRFGLIVTTFILLFFGQDIFGFDLSMLVHSSGISVLKPEQNISTSHIAARKIVDES